MKEATTQTFCNMIIKNWFVSVKMSLQTSDIRMKWAGLNLAENIETANKTKRTRIWLPNMHSINVFWKCGMQ